MSVPKHASFTLPLPELVRLTKLVSEVALDVLNDVKVTDWSPEEALRTYQGVVSATTGRSSLRPSVTVSIPFARGLFELLELLVAEIATGKTPSKRLLRRLCLHLESLPREALDPHFPEDDLWPSLGIISRA
jgi:hypothetical protein